MKDATNFKRITNNPCDKIKKQLNKLIRDINSKQTNGRKVLDEIEGDYSPGYVYGNIKTHKADNKLRLITSQIPTPTYKLSKQLDKLIKKYLPQGYMLKSSSEFVEMLQSQQHDGIMYSLDVEALFPNVPINRTINIILDKVYNHTDIPPPPIPKNSLKELLEICTTQVPFRDPKGKMWTQIDGMTMGGPLSVRFADFFMSEVENQALNNISSRPSMYGRYVDDVFLVCHETLMLELKDKMTVISGLNFTVEKSFNNKLPFLNVLVEKVTGQFKTSIYRKPTDVGSCMNANGDCPDQYKTSVIKGFLWRAKKLTTEKEEFLLELKRAKQILVNNGFSNTMVNNEIKWFLRRSVEQRPVEPIEVHRLFYQNFMNSGYRQDEEAIREIVTNNIKTKDANNKIKLIIYYKTRKTSQYFMKNCISPKPRELATTNVIYDFKCKREECINLTTPENTYIGATTCTLSRRISLHLQNGAIITHFTNKHLNKTTRKEFEEWTEIRYIERDVARLFILEALIIKFEDPVLNRQDTGRKRTLKLYGDS